MGALGVLRYLFPKSFISILRSLAYLPMRRFLNHPKPINRELLQIPSRESGRTIKAWIYFPPRYNKDTSYPVLVNWHGSGFILPSLGLDYEFCDRLARDIGVVVIDADYRKAPEHPYPAAVEDAEDILRWVESQPGQFDSNRVAVSGFSAGGNLALVAASDLQKRLKKIDIKAAYAFYPLVDLARDPATKTVTNPMNPFPVFMLRLFNACYVAEAEQRRDPRVSPIYAAPTDFSGAIFIFTCSGDNLSVEAEEMGENLKHGGANVELVKLDKVPHGFDKNVLPGSLGFEKKELAYSRVVHNLKDIIGTPGSNDLRT